MEIKKGHVDIAISKYVTNALQKFQHKPPTITTSYTTKWTKPAYGQKTQYVMSPCTPHILDKNGTTIIQPINLTFVYYTLIVILCMLPAINENLLQQAKPTDNTNEKLVMIMDYAHTYPDAVIK